MADSNVVTQDDTSVAWILIFTDMVALLLSFFVMLFSMSAVPVNEWETTIDILEEARFLKCSDKIIKMEIVNK